MAEGKLAWGRRQVDGWRKGPWTSQEDKLLVEHVRQHGEGRWNSVSKLAGLKRSGKSCRLRWVNYLRPDLKRSKITPQEESLIVQLHSLWGNRWSTIARSLPGRTDNEIKNYWRTHFKKGKPSKNIERARARFLKQRREMQTQQQQLITPGHGKVDVAADHQPRGGALAAAGAVDEDHSGGVEPPPAAGDVDLTMIMQDVMDFMCPLSSSFVLLHGAGQIVGGGGGGGGSCCPSTSEECGSSEEDGATWGSLWNLEDVADDVDGALWW